MSGDSDPGQPAGDAGALDDEERPIPGLASAWTLGDGDRIERDDIDHPAESGNAAWRDGAARVFGARNEVVAFQLVVESDAAGIADLDVRLLGLEQRDGRAEILYSPPGDDPSDFVGRPIQIFTEGYMHVSEPSEANWVFRPGSAAVPDDPTGDKPVQLVPENARAGRGGLPIDIGPSQNQAFWFDIYIPRGLPAGFYDGEIELRAGGGLQRIPVELEVFDFTLPDESSLTTMIYFEPSQIERYQGRDLESRYHRFAHRYRAELSYAYDPSSLAAAAGRFSGADFTASHGYDGPGVATGNRIAAASFYGPGTAYDQRAGAWETSDAWMQALSTHAPAALTFLYMPDEPSSSQYGYIRQLADNIKSNPGPGRLLPIFVTTSYASGLDGAIDIWCSPAASLSPARAESERQRGRRYWFYNGTRPETGALTIDAPGTDARVNAWAAFKHGVDTYFYWHAVHWRHNSQKQGERDQNVWAETITFDNRGQPGKPSAHQGFIHGDGVLLYPGEDLLHPDQDRGIAGPIASFRFANLRRGSQDHLYLTMARELGLDDEIETALSEVVPAVFTEAGSSVSFAQTGDAFDEARYRLGRSIAEQH